MSHVVSRPDELIIEVQEKSDDDGEVRIIHVQPADEDIGKCLGRDGRNATALRRVIGIITYNVTGIRHYFKINVPELPEDEMDI